MGHITQTLKLPGEDRQKDNIRANVVAIMIHFDPLYRSALLVTVEDGICRLVQIINHWPEPAGDLWMIAVKTVS